MLQIGFWKEFRFQGSRELFEKIFFTENGGLFECLKAFELKIT